jgi:hypothetical protein
LYQVDRTPVQGYKIGRIISKNSVDNKKLLVQVGFNPVVVQQKTCMPYGTAKRSTKSQTGHAPQWKTNGRNGGPNTRKLSIDIKRTVSTSLRVVEGTKRKMDGVNGAPI